MDKPKRKYEMQLTMGADDLPSLRGMLNTLIYDLARLEDSDVEKVNPYHAISGGYSGNHSIEIRIQPDMDHDKYMDQLNAYIDARKEPTA